MTKQFNWNDSGNLRTAKKVHWEDAGALRDATNIWYRDEAQGELKLVFSQGSGESVGIPTDHKALFVFSELDLWAPQDIPKDQIQMYEFEKFQVDVPEHVIAEYDPRQIETLFQDTAMTIPVTEAGQVVKAIKDISGNDNHGLQSDPDEACTYQIDANRQGYLRLAKGRDGGGIYTLSPDGEYQIIQTAPGLGAWQYKYTASNSQVKITVNHHDADVNWGPMMILSGTVSVEDRTTEVLRMRAATATYPNTTYTNCTSLLHTFELVGNTDDWDVENVTSMRWMFYRSDMSDPEFSLNNWHPVKLTDAFRTFKYATIGCPIIWPDTDSLEQTRAMFESASFNSRLVLNLQKCSNMSEMFEGLTGDQTSLDMQDCTTSSLTNVANMFANGDFNGPMNNFDISPLTSLSKMFNKARAFNQPLDTWDTSNVTNMNEMFQSAAAFSQPLSFDMRKVTACRQMFYGDIGNCDLSGLQFGPDTVLEDMFYFSQYNHPSPNEWDISKLQSLYRIFYNAKAFNQPLDKWNLTSATQTMELFRDQAFNQQLDTWDTGNITNMNGMFYNCAFNQPLSLDMRKVTECVGMFQGSSYNADLSGLQFGPDTVLEQMFYFSHYNHPSPNEWDISKLQSLYRIFYNAKAFNQPLDKWNLTSATQTMELFRDQAFNQQLDTWDTGNITNMNGMFYNCAFNQPLSLDMRRVTECVGMFQGSSYNADLSGLVLGPDTRLAKWMYFQNANPPSLASLDISQCTTLERFLYQQRGFNNQLDGLDTGHIADMYEMFKGQVFNQPLSLDMSSVTRCEGMFEGSTFSNDMSGVRFQATTVTQNMFYFQSFNHPQLSDIDVSMLTSMRNMLRHQKKFNQPLDSWNTGQVTSMEGMFEGQVFNQPVSFDMRKVTNVEGMFESSAFNSSLNGCQFSDVTSVNKMFYFQNFNHSQISSLDVTDLSSLKGFFREAHGINQPLDSWEVKDITNMQSMFDNAKSFNQPLGQWDVRKVTGMESMFESAKVFNQDLSTWQPTIGEPSFFAWGAPIANTPAFLPPWV